MENNIITFADEEGNALELEIIAEFHDEENNHNYIIYTDNIKDENGDLEYFASEMVEDGGRITLKEIKDQYLIDDMASEIDKLIENR